MKATSEAWIKTPDNEGNGLLKIWIDGEVEFPLAISTHNVRIDDVSIGEEQDFTIILEAYKELEIYESEDDDSEGKDTFSMAEESVIPCGLFKTVVDDGFYPNATAIFSGRITELYDCPEEYGFEADDQLFSFVCLGNEFDCVNHTASTGEADLEVGKIVNGLFWVQGWTEV